jgi:hypothetical protein
VYIHLDTLVAQEPDFLLQALHVVVVGVVHAGLVVGLARPLLHLVLAHPEIGMGTHSH